MDTPGIILKTEREKQKKSLEEIAGSLKLNIEYLKAIENEQYQLIPAEIYTKAYLRFYAGALGLDCDSIMGLYQKQINVPPVRKPAQPEEKEKEAVFPYKPALIIASVVSIALLLIIIVKHREPDIAPVQGTKKPVVAETEEVKPEEESPALEAPSVTGIKVPEINGEIPGTEKTGVTEEQTAPAAGEVKRLSLEISVTDTAWISAGIDGDKPKEWLLKSGEKISLSASEKFVVKTGNAGGTRVIFNGQDIGPVGERGEVIEIVLPEGGKKQY
ncbi:MAG: DUF4115 domain-containing protein [Nitrospiraceae bacterium]|nr:MAG: DUF4115 domain-containing protein [Nitrospiraceae bacterium]